MFKVYTSDEDQCSGATTDNFNCKFRLFIERFLQADIPENDRRHAFSNMLSGHARLFFFDALYNKNLDLMALSRGITERFQTSEKTRALLCEWESFTLTSFMTKTWDNTQSACL